MSATGRRERWEPADGNARAERSTDGLPAGGDGEANAAKAVAEAERATANKVSGLG